jgi:hypothetical protein
MQSYNENGSLAHVSRSPVLTAINLSSTPVPSTPILPLSISVPATTRLPIGSAATDQTSKSASTQQTKLTTEIDGGLEKMASDRTPDERKAEERLVCFKRVQSGSTISATFDRAGPRTMTSQSIHIRCMWRKEKAKNFIRHSGIMCLLKQLLDVHFNDHERADIDT